MHVRSGLTAGIDCKGTSQTSQYAIIRKERNQRWYVAKVGQRGVFIFAKLSLTDIDDAPLSLVAWQSTDFCINEVTRSESKPAITGASKLLVGHGRTSWLK